MELQQQQQPAEAAGAAGVILRVKRRRDYQAPQHIGKTIKKKQFLAPDWLGQSH